MRQLACEFPSLGGFCSCLNRETSWSSQNGGILLIASLIVVHGLRDVCSAEPECVGLGKGGRGSPGLGEWECELAFEDSMTIAILGDLP